MTHWYSVRSSRCNIGLKSKSQHLRHTWQLNYWITLSAILVIETPELTCKSAQVLYRFNAKSRWWCHFAKCCNAVFIQSHAGAYWEGEFEHTKKLQLWYIGLVDQLELVRKTVIYLSSCILDQLDIYSVGEVVHLTYLWFPHYHRKKLDTVYSCVSSTEYCVIFCFLRSIIPSMIMDKG